MVDGLMVRRRACHYHLPDSMPIKFVFEGMKGSWLIRADLTCLGHESMPCLPRCIVRVGDSSGVDDSDTLKLRSLVITEKTKGKDKDDAKRFCCLKPPLPQCPRNLCPSKKKTRKRHRSRDGCKELIENAIGKGWHCKTVENLLISVQVSSECEDQVVPTGKRKSSPSGCSDATSSDVMSVGGIIKRYFTNSSEVSSVDGPSRFNLSSRAGREKSKRKLTSKCARAQPGSFEEFAVQTPPRLLTLPLSTQPTPKFTSDLIRRGGVGKSVVTASCNLASLATPHKPLLSHYESTKKKHSNRCISPIKFSVFEISEDDE